MINNDGVNTKHENNGAPRQEPEESFAPPSVAEKHALERGHSLTVALEARRAVRGGR
jgi:hypothetical protein